MNSRLRITNLRSIVSASMVLDPDGNERLQIVYNVRTGRARYNLLKSADATVPVLESEGEIDCGCIGWPVKMARAREIITDAVNAVGKVAPLRHSEVMSNVVCKDCGKSIPHPTKYQYLCAECARRNKSGSSLRERVCADCGNRFMGYPKSKRCPDCQHARELKLRAEYRSAQKKGHTRVLGGTYLCEVCGKPYILTGGKQKYCPACKESATKEACRALSREKQRRRLADNRVRKAKLRVCVVCGKPLPVGVLGITCSPECALERRRQWQRTADARRGGSGDTNIVTTKTNPDKYAFGDGSPRQDSPPRKNEKTHTASCTMSEDDVLEFRAIAARNGTTASALIRKWITSYLAGEQVEPEKDRLK